MSTKRKKQRQPDGIAAVSPKTNMKELIADGGPVMQREVEITYTCGLCARTHMGSVYFTAPTDSIQEFRKMAEEGIRANETAVTLLPQISRLIHEDRGDYGRLTKEWELTGGRRYSTILDVHVTDESGYTCNHCDATFENMADLRYHQGRNPRTGTLVKGH